MRYANIQWCCASDARGAQPICIVTASTHADSLEMLDISSSELRRSAWQFSEISNMEAEDRINSCDVPYDSDSIKSHRKIGLSMGKEPKSGLEPPDDASRRATESVRLSGQVAFIG